jgi:Ca2+/Na+ antiporter
MAGGAGAGVIARARTVLASPASVTFLVSRAAIWIVALLGYTLIYPHRNPAADAVSHAPIQHDLGWATDLWAHWDGAWYLTIAEHGYASNAGTAAFFPLYPGVLAIAGRVLGGNFILAGILLSLAAAFAAALLLDRLARLHGIDGGRAVLYLVVFPMSFFLQAVYSEAFYLLLAVAALLLAERGRFALAAVATAFATLARPTAVALVVAVAVLAWQSEQRRRALPWLLVVPVVFAAFPLTLKLQIHDAWAFFDAQSSWHRHLSHWGPFAGIWDGLRAGWDGLATLAGGSGPTDLPFLDAHQVAATNVEAAAFLLVFLWLTVETWRRLGAAYGLFAAVSLAIPLSEPAAVLPPLSLPRFGVVIVPFFLVLAKLGERPRLNTAMVMVSTLLLGLTVVEWALWNWVA